MEQKPETEMYGNKPEAQKENFNLFSCSPVYVEFFFGFRYPIYIF